MCGDIIALALELLLCRRLLGQADRALVGLAGIYPAHPAITSRVFQQTSRQYIRAPERNPRGRFHEDCEEAERMRKRMWHILKMICRTQLWTDRNDVVH